ncbi:MAG TPA: dTDP-glucose 4,6-dehydratase [Armatimonadetes bacterium]|jgi:dTDP-glucose 4,6-dehydratase|nr:dTDP-glucose 4,6-dehydratase [Armatimonadota bacterium]
MKYLVTGGCGFIGCNLVRFLLENRAGASVRILDALTYAGSLDNLGAAAEDARVEFIQGDICDAEAVRRAMGGCEGVIHLAAESHVDRSIFGAEAAVRTNFEGTFRVLEAAREVGIERFLHVSTDEVYGAAEGVSFDENAPLLARNPYSASKAGADTMARAYWITYGLPVLITRPANNYGPYQYPEKLVPLFVYKALRDEPLPVYGDGMQVRDWLHVDDHCRAMLAVLERGEPGEAYNIPAHNERPNLQTIRLILHELGKPESLITYVEDRPGHDVRYSMTGEKLAALGWRPEVDWEAGMRASVRWFAEHLDWLEASYARGKAFFEQWYRNR